MSALVKANLAVLVLLLAHTLDHGINQADRELPESSTLVGVIGLAIVTFSAIVALRGSQRAPIVGFLAGAITFWGVVAVHLVPQWWGWLSDPYWDFATNPGNWISLITLLAAAAWLEFVGLRELGVVRMPRNFRHADNPAPQQGQ